MRRVYRNVHIALITALVLAAVAFEATANERVRYSDGTADLIRPLGGR